MDVSANAKEALQRACSPPDPALWCDHSAEESEATKRSASEARDVCGKVVTAGLFESRRQKAESRKQKEIDPSS
jgi:hypothetical protein